MSDEGSENMAAGTVRLKKPKISPLDQLRSQRNWNLARLNKAFLRPREIRLFDFLTVGTSNKKPEELLQAFKLPVFSCYNLIDVRNNPNSMHTPYWNKNSILQLCKSEGIQYLHRPDLGVPGNIRKLLFSGEMSYEVFFSWYDKNILTQENLQQMAEMIRSNSVAFMCTEIGPTYCHRHRIAIRLEESFGYVSFDL